MLKDLRNEKSNQNTEKLEEDDKKVENKSDQEKKVDEENFQLSISEIDLLRQQLSSCWIAPAGAVIEKGMTVKISAKLQQNRRVSRRQKGRRKSNKNFSKIFKRNN